MPDLPGSAWSPDRGIVPSALWPLNLAARDLRRDRVMTIRGTLEAVAVAATELRPAPALGESFRAC
jgi:hypothetical protein